MLDQKTGCKIVTILHDVLLWQKGGNTVRADPGALDSKLREMYPEIEKHDLTLSLSFDRDKAAWIIKLVNGKHSLITDLDRIDADACINGAQCFNLEMQISQFLAKL